ALRPKLRRGDGEEMPLAGYALELVSAAVVEFEPGADHEVAQRGGHEDVVGPARALSRAPMCTAIPPMSSPRTSHSPVCNPARTWMPSACTASRWRGYRRAFCRSSSSSFARSGRLLAAVLADRPPHRCE